MPDSTGEKFQKLVSIMARLRAPGGCPWDREQTFDSIKPYTARRNLRSPRRHRPPRLARTWPKSWATSSCRPSSTRRWPPKQNLFTIDDSLDAINEKLVRRHPHVFGEETAADAKATCSSIWGEVKAAEKKDKGEADADAARRCPARAAGAGRSAADRLARRRRRLRLGERRTGASRSCTRNSPNSNAAESHDHLEDELGDMLFVIVNLARFVKVDPEQALRRTNAKFRQRFGYVEAKLAEQGKQLEGCEYRGNGGIVAGSEAAIEIRAAVPPGRIRARSSSSSSEIWGFADLELLPAALPGRGRARSAATSSAPTTARE